MKHLLLPALLAVSLMGCPPDVQQNALASFDGFYDWKMQQIVRLVSERNALPADSPRRAELDIRIGLERETLENAAIRLLMRGIQYTTPDGQFQIKVVEGAEYQLQGRWTPIQPMASIGALAPSQATTRPEARP